MQIQSLDMGPRNTGVSTSDLRSLSKRNGWMFQSAMLQAGTGRDLTSQKTNWAMKSLGPNDFFKDIFRWWCPDPQVCGGLFFYKPWSIGFSRIPGPYCKEPGFNAKFLGGFWNNRASADSRCSPDLSCVLRVARTRWFCWDHILRRHVNGPGELSWGFGVGSNTMKVKEAVREGCQNIQLKRLLICFGLVGW